MSKTNSKTARNSTLVLLALSAILGVLDFMFPNDHPHFTPEKYPLFYGAFGFIAFVAIVFVSKVFLSPIVTREEDYYDR